MMRAIRLAALWAVLVIAVPVLAHPPGSAKWIRKEVNGPAPDFTLTDQDGRKVSLRELRGAATVINFVFTHCATGCPLTTAKLRTVQLAFGAKPLRLVSISFDPAHDTPRVMREYAERLGADLANWSFLTGTTEEIQPVLFDYKIEVTRGGTRDSSGALLTSAIVDHGVKTVLIDKNGMKRVEYWGQEFDTRVVIKDITLVLEEK